MPTPSASEYVNIADGTDPTRLLRVNADGSLNASIPRHPKLAVTLDPNNAAGNRTIGANVAIGARVNMPATGTIDRLAVWVTVQNGNVDCGIYDTTATTRNRLTPSVAAAAAAAGAWQQFTVSLAVSQGDAVDFVCATDSATFAISAGSMNAAGQAVLPTGWVVVPLGGAPRLVWQTSTSYPLPATIAESGMGTTGGFTPLIIARYV